MKKCLFPINAYVVWCPTWTKNLGRYLVCKVPPKEFWFDQTSRSLRCNVKLIKIVYCKVNIFRGSFKFEGCFCSRKLLADVNWECLTLLITVVNFDESFVCSKLSCLTRLLFSVQPIRMSHWCHTMVDGAKFWITCKRLNYWEKLVAYNWFKIQRHLKGLLWAGATHQPTKASLASSTIMWRQCDIRIVAWNF